MRILFVSNYYPPLEVGGYEQVCRDVAERLVTRGHSVRVLTSNYGARSRPDDEPSYIRRELRLQIDYDSRGKVPCQMLWRRPRAGYLDRNVLHREIADFGPDVVFFWNQHGLPRSLASEAEARADVGVAFWLAGYNPAAPDEYWHYWSASRRTRAGKALDALVRRHVLSYLGNQASARRPAMRHVAVVSEYYRREGVKEGTLPAHARVIYNGIEAEHFYHPIAPEPAGDLWLLQAGRVGPDKGVHLAIDALGRLVGRHPDIPVRLRIAGSGAADYVAGLHEMVRHQSLDDRVLFLGRLPRNKIPDVMASSHVLLLPSVVEEAFARVVLEAMASGLATIAANSGGTPEIVEHDVSGLLFVPGSSADLSVQIERLLTEPGLRSRLAEEGQRRALGRFTMDRMVDEIEIFLAEAAEGQRRELA